MTQDLFVQVGRVVFINFGPDAGKTAVVLDFITDSTILIEGPTSGVQRQVIPLSRVEVTKFRVAKVLRNQRSGALKKLCDAFKLNERWSQTEKAKRLARQQKRAQLGDFDRFKVVTLKRQLGKAVRTHLKGKTTKAAPKKK
jgi:large subunit ribosomal protein L14e